MRYWGAIFKWWHNMLYNKIYHSTNKLQANGYCIIIVIKGCDANS